MVSKRGKAQSCFYEVSTHLLWLARDLEEKAASCFACSQKKKREKRSNKKNCQGNRKSLPCMLCLVDAASSQGLNHTRLNSHGRHGNTEMPQSDSEHCHCCAPTPPVWDRCLSHVCALWQLQLLLKLQISLFPRRPRAAYSLPSAIMLIRPSPNTDTGLTWTYCLEIERNLKSKYSRCQQLLALRWNNKHAGGKVTISIAELGLRMIYEPPLQ